MGVLNVTPDSFSDGADHFAREAATKHGWALAAQGADIIDVGGESTRPGATRVGAGEEARRVIPVVRVLALSGLVVSVDTMRASVARLALEAGAAVVNDVSGGLADPEMAGVIADSGATYVVSHWRGHSGQMARLARYHDVVGEVCAELSDRLDALRSAGVSESQLVVDPGIGFAKRPEHDWALLARLDRLAEELGRPVLVGASRKSFLGALVESRTGEPAPPLARESATTAVTTLAAAAGIWCVRVHDARAARDAVDVAMAWGTQSRGHAH
jgi:dihydropteroate synthase